MSEERLPAEPTPEPDLDPNLDEPPVDEADLDEVEPEAEAEPEYEPEPEPEPQRQSRRDRQTENWRSRAQEAERRTQELERRMAAFEGRQQLPDPRAAQQAAAEEERQFRESLVGLMPEEISLKVAERVERRIMAQMAQTQVQSFDRNDRRDFEQEATRSRFAQSKSQEVEQMLTQMRNQGIYQFGRLDILDFLAGRDQRLKREQTTQQQRRQGARNVDRQTVRPASGRGEGGGGNRRQSEEEADIAFLKRTRVGDVI